MIVPHVSSHLICIVADTAAAGGHPAPTQLAVDYVRIHEWWPAPDGGAAGG